MHTNLWFWIAFNAGVLCVLAIDLFGFRRKAHAPSTKEAAIWTAVWVALSLGFNALIWLWEGHARALEWAHLRFVKDFAGLFHFFMEERAACYGR